MKVHALRVSLALLAALGTAGGVSRAQGAPPAGRDGPAPAVPPPSGAPPGAEKRPEPPAQPATGYGGAEYPHAKVKSTSGGDGGRAYWIFEPSDPAPATAPVVAFLHGWGGMDPEVYRAWIDHLARRGRIVIFPRYQADLRTLPPEMTPNAAWSVRDALGRLEGGAGVKPDRGRFAIVGHSLGGIIGMNLAARGTREGLPSARAVMAVEPGDSRGSLLGGIRVPTTFEPYGALPPELLLLAVVGEDDGFVGDAAARRILREAARVPAENKNLVTVRSDAHGFPPLRAGHFAPLGRKGGAMVDALDTRAFWRLFDALQDAAFEGQGRRYAIGGTPEQRFMGVWSDGTPVKELEVERP